MTISNLYQDECCNQLGCRDSITDNAGISFGLTYILNLINILAIVVVEEMDGMQRIFREIPYKILIGLALASSRLPLN